MTLTALTFLILVSFQVDCYQLLIGKPLDDLISSLNTKPPNSWPIFATPPVTTGTHGVAFIGKNASVGNSFDSFIATTLKIQNTNFLKKIQELGKYIYYSNENVYKGFLVILDINAHIGQLESVLIASKLQPHPVDPLNPIELVYFIIKSSTNVIQQYTLVNQRKCHSCFRCPFGKCCCHDNWVPVPRGDTPGEILLILNLLQYDQYQWLLKLNITGVLMRPIRLNEGDQSDFVCKLMGDYIKNMSSSNISSKFSEFTTNFILDAETSVFSIPTQNMLINFINEQLGSNNFSPPVTIGLNFSNRYTVIRTLEISTKKEGTSFMWIIINPKLDSFEVTQIQSFVNLIPSIEPEDKFNQPFQTFDFLMSQYRLISSWKEVNFRRGSTTNSNGPIMINETLRLDILNFISIAFAQYRSGNRCPLNYTNSLEDPPSLSPLTPPPSDTTLAPTTSKWGQIFGELTNSMNLISGTWKSIAEAFKTKVSKKICDITRLGFTHYSHEAELFKVVDLPKEHTLDFVKSVIDVHSLNMDPYKLISFEFGRSNISWEQHNFLFQQTQTSHVNFLSFLKALNTEDSSMSFIVISLKSSFDLAPDLRVITTDRSVLGGIFESHKTKITEIPKVLHLNETIALLQFFRAVAFGMVADDLNVKHDWPIVPDDSERCYN